MDDASVARKAETAVLHVWLRELLGIPLCPPKTRSEAIVQRVVDMGIDDTCTSIQRIRHRLLHLPDPDEDLAPYNDGLALQHMCRVVARYLGSSGESTVSTQDYWAHKWMLFARSAAEHCGVYDAGLQLPQRSKEITASTGILISTFHALVRVMEETLAAPADFEAHTEDVLLQSVLPSVRLAIVPPESHNASVLHKIADDTKSTMRSRVPRVWGNDDSDSDDATDTKTTAEGTTAREQGKNDSSSSRMEPVTLHDFESIVRSGALQHGSSKTRSRRRRRNKTNQSAIATAATETETTTETRESTEKEAEAKADGEGVTEATIEEAK